MGNSLNFRIPEWLDKAIFETMGGRHVVSPERVRLNPEQDFEFGLVYLGTYFPRSYAEAYGIAAKLLGIKHFRDTIAALEEVRILDLFCGTGGEIVGLIMALQDFCPEVKRIRIDAYDANPNYVMILNRLLSEISPHFSAVITPNLQPFFIDCLDDLTDFAREVDSGYHFILSFKAVNEFVQQGMFPGYNAYNLVVSTFADRLAETGVFVMADLSNKDKKIGIYYPKLMNAGINAFVRDNGAAFRSIVPLACHWHEQKCHGCYLQDIFYVTHSQVRSERTKIAYRVLARRPFADALCANTSAGRCEFSTPGTEPIVPYLE